MKSLNPIKDPILLKRLLRFRKKKQAYWSFLMLVALFAISLASELICNNRPLYVRHAGRSFFPVFKYYPEDTFTGNGKQTRPDYKELRRSPAFADDSANFMVFPPISHGPYESVDPDSLRSAENVTLTLAPIPHVGNVNLRPDLTIERAMACGFFFCTTDADVRGRVLTDHWNPGKKMRNALKLRFGNKSLPPISTTLTGTGDPPMEAVLSLSRFTSRSRPPRTVRLTFREPSDGLPPKQVVVFDHNLSVTGPAPQAWTNMDTNNRTTFLGLVRQAFVGPVYPEPVILQGTKFAATIEKDDISWPHPPVPGHWMGIDSAGRDVLARVLYGLRVSIIFGLLLVTASMALGITMGAIQGYYGGKVDITAQRLIEIWSALPFLYVMILMGSIYGQSFALLLFCYGIFNWIGISYYIRAEFLRLRALPFVDSARCMGIPARKIIFRHILPNALTPVITFFPFSLVGAIGSLAALDYLGFGLPAPTPSWGQLLHQAQQFRWAWWLILYPSLTLFLVMLLGVFIGEGVRDAYDPRPYSRME